MWLWFGAASMPLVIGVGVCKGQIRAAHAVSLW